MQYEKTGPDDPKVAYDATNSALTMLATTYHPALGIAVGMAMALFGPAVARRHDRAEDLINYVQADPSDFAAEILENRTFQDGFVYLMERYIRERNDDKRLILQKVLQGYAKAPELLDFPLEEMTDLVSRIRMQDVAVLRSALQEEASDTTRGTNGEPQSFMLKEDPNAVSRLIYFGLLHEDRTKNGPSVREYDDKSYLYVWISPAGREFANYINRAANGSSLTS